MKDETCVRCGRDADLRKVGEQVVCKHCEPHVRKALERQAAYGPGGWAGRL